jgi:RNA polymerase sigma-70 factor (ECF subfamily)
MTSIESEVPRGSSDIPASLRDARRLFLEAVDDLRPRLHRFCARMVGSALDGEDVVQETLAQALYSLSSLKDHSRFEPWIFRIAHHKCVDFLRRERRQREDTVPYDDEHDHAAELDDDAPDDEPIGAALAVLVGELPPKERACLILKDVLDWQLAEVAAVVDSTVGGVKAALHRGRYKLRALHRAPTQADLDQEQRRLLLAYVDCFNRQDWDALRRLVRDDARLEVVGETEGSLRDIGYFRTYSGLPWEWKLSLARVDDETLIVHWRRSGAEWRPMSAIRLWFQDGKVARIRDYAHAEYLLEGAWVEVTEDG